MLWVQPKRKKKVYQLIVGDRCCGEYTLLKRARIRGCNFIKEGRDAGKDLADVQDASQQKYLLPRVNSAKAEKTWNKKLFAYMDGRMV